MGLASSARVSAKTGQGVDKAFEGLILRVYEVEHGRGEEVPPPTKPKSLGGLTLTPQEVPLGQDTSECCS